MQYPRDEKFLPVDQNTRGRRQEAVALGLERRKEVYISVVMLIRRVEPADQENVLRLLRTDFYPYEPCAVGLDLCPLGYR